MTFLYANNPAGSQSQQGPDSRTVQQARIKSEHERATKDSERLLTLTRELREEVLAHAETPFPAALRERLRELEAAARDLRKGLEAMDVNTLSFQVVTGAHDIREEAKALRKIFQQSRSKPQREKLRRLAREIEKRADSIYDRTRHP